MTYFAAVFARGLGGWAGREVNLDEIETLDEIAELMRDTAGEDDLALLFVEENEEWFAILRVDGVDDPRILISDVRAPQTSELAALVYVEAEQEPESEEEQQTRMVAGEPGGDADLLEDLGYASHELLSLIVGEGLLPADVISTIAERLGFASEFDKLR